MNIGAHTLRNYLGPANTLVILGLSWNWSEFMNTSELTTFGGKLSLY